MNTLLIATAAVETATGLALLGLPLLVVSLLLGGSLDTPATLVVARMAVPSRFLWPGWLGSLSRRVAKRRYASGAMPLSRTKARSTALSSE